MGKMSGVSSALDFLHECGHLINDDLTKDAACATDHYMVNYFRKPMIKEKSRFVALKYRDEAVRASERAAWAYALKSARKIKEQYRVDIVAKMGGAQKVINYIDKYLKNYDDQTKTELEVLGYDPFIRSMVTEILRTKTT